MKNQEKLNCPTTVKSNYNRVEKYIGEIQDKDREKFHADFKRLPRKLQYFIIKLVTEHNRLRRYDNPASEDIKIVLSWIDAFLILNYSEHKIIFYVKELYLKADN